MSYMVGVDIGGTFTDCAVFDEGAGRFITGKAPTTPQNPAEGFFNALEAAAAAGGLDVRRLLTDTVTLVNGTTVGTNAIVTKRGAKVGLLTTAGHGEALMIMRGGGRTKGLSIDELLYIPGAHKADPLVASDCIEEVAERIDCKGAVVVALDERGAEAALRRLLAKGIEALAICLLWSPMNPAHEQALAAIARRVAPDLFVSCSHEVSPMVGEYPRAVAAVFNACIGPLMKRYVTGLEKQAAEAGYKGRFLFAQCVGGCVPGEQAEAVPLYTIDSGPVSGVAASSILGPRMGYPNIITTDMGGTTFDVGIVHQGTALTRSTTVLGRYEMAVSMVDVVSIGAGGGSIAYIDPASGGMRVGPRSAGAEPGPMCYGQGGTEPTVTDANLVLGILDPDYFLGGKRKLNAELAREGVGRLAKALGLGLEETAAGICQIVDNMMAGEIRRMTLFRGYDPREFVVFAFGGGGPTHAGAYARELGVKQVVVPLGNCAAVWSALGTYLGGVVHVYDRNEFMREPFEARLLNGIFNEMEEHGRNQLAAEGFTRTNMDFERFISLKYGAQISSLEIPYPPAGMGQHEMDSLVSAFEASYARRYGEGAGFREAGVEVMKLRLRAVGRLPEVNPVKLPRITTNGHGPATVISKRRVYWWEAEGFLETPVLNGERLGPGAEVKGPAIIELPHTTMPVRPGQTSHVDDYGNIVLNVGG
ncbi:MAG TPA: hydantoinase/oxoprolinase family protein [Candidatus Binataceae bacterium]|jgi:N-methylhydantoinase A|nr:hydantoinase/oxoprolinase family protein [Candidatus Binataceae bacterium]